MRFSVSHNCDSIGAGILQLDSDHFWWNYSDRNVTMNELWWIFVLEKSKRQWLLFIKYINQTKIRSLLVELFRILFGKWNSKWTNKNTCFVCFSLCPVNACCAILNTLAIREWVVLSTKNLPLILPCIFAPNALLMYMTILSIYIKYIGNVVDLKENKRISGTYFSRIVAYPIHSEWILHAILVCYFQILFKLWVSCLYKQ